VGTRSVWRRDSPGRRGLVGGGRQCGWLRGDHPRRRHRRFSAPARWCADFDVAPDGSVVVVLSVQSTIPPEVFTVTQAVQPSALLALQRRVICVLYLAPSKAVGDREKTAPRCTRGRAAGGQSARSALGPHPGGPQGSWEDAWISA